VNTQRTELAAGQLSRFHRKRPMASKFAEYKQRKTLGGCFFVAPCMCLCVVQGHHAVADMWQKSGLQWSEFLSDADKVDEFLSKHVSCQILLITVNLFEHDQDLFMVLLISSGLVPSKRNLVS